MISRQANTTLIRITLLRWSLAAVPIGAIRLQISAPADFASPSVALVSTTASTPTATLAATRNPSGQLLLQTSTSAATLKRLLPSGTVPASWQRAVLTDSQNRVWYRRTP